MGRHWPCHRYRDVDLYRNDAQAAVHVFWRRSHAIPGHCHGRAAGDWRIGRAVSGTEGSLDRSGEDVEKRVGRGDRLYFGFHARQLKFLERVNVEWRKENYAGNSR